MTERMSLRGDALSAVEGRISDVAIFDFLGARLLHDVRNDAFYDMRVKRSNLIIGVNSYIE